MRRFELLDRVVSRFLQKQASVQRIADLAPPLGYPGGPCHVLERVENEVRNPRLKKDLQERVEKGKSLTNPEAAKVYSVELERGPWKFKTLLLSVHAQYRMDLRGLTVPELRLALNNYFRQYNTLKSRNDPAAQKVEMAMLRSEKIEYTDQQTGMTVVFTADIVRKQIEVISVWWEGQPDPGPANYCRIPGKN